MSAPRKKRTVKGGHFADWADRRAERLFDLVRNAIDDDNIVRAIAKDLRTAAGQKEPDETLDGPDFEPLW